VTRTPQLAQSLLFGVPPQCRGRPHYTVGIRRVVIVHQGYIARTRPEAFTAAYATNNEAGTRTFRNMEVPPIRAQFSSATKPVIYIHGPFNWQFESVSAARRCIVLIPRSSEVRFLTHQEFTNGRLRWARAGTREVNVSRAHVGTRPDRFARVGTVGSWRLIASQGNVDRLDRPPGAPADAPTKGLQ
jgi:hypothetical protein